MPATSQRWALVAPAGFTALAVLEQATGHPYRAVTLLALALAALLVGTVLTVRRVQWATPAIVPLALSATLGAAGLERAALAASVAGVAIVVLLAAGVEVESRIDRALSAIASGLRRAAGLVAFVILVLPGWAISRLRRRDPLRSAEVLGSTWVDRTSPDRRPLGLGAATDAAGGTRRTLIGRLSWAVGCFVLVAAANYGVGYAWDRAFDASSPPPATATPAVADISMDATVHDPRADTPAMAGAPWRERYFRDLQRTRGGYWPFTEYRPEPFTSPYINLRGWERTSYVPAGDTDDMPTAWMFGGSTTWGEGQRDEYTIASWIARLAEEDHLPVHVRNYGERGWTHFQEMILYEQLLAAGPTPDLAIFYDGLNEITTQSLVTEPVPSHTLAFTYAKLLFGQNLATKAEADEPVSGSELLTDLRDVYERHSAVHKLADLLRGDPAGASPALPGQDGGGVGSGFEANQNTDPGGGITNYNMTERDGVDAGKVYERGKQFTLMLSQRYDVQPFLFWQPARSRGKPQVAAERQLTDPTIDISDALEGHDADVFIDGGHTNEEGARIVAVRIWKELKPAIEAWYEGHR